MYNGSQQSHASTPMSTLHVGVWVTYDRLFRLNRSLPNDKYTFLLETFAGLLSSSTSECRLLDFHLIVDFLLVEFKSSYNSGEVNRLKYKIHDVREVGNLQRSSLFARDKRRRGTLWVFFKWTKICGRNKNVSLPPSIYRLGLRL